MSRVLLVLGRSLELATGGTIVFLASLLGQTAAFADRELLTAPN